MNLVGLLNDLFAIEVDEPRHLLDFDGFFGYRNPWARILFRPEFSDCERVGFIVLASLQIRAYMVLDADGVHY